MDRVDGHRTAVYTAGEKIILCFNFTFNSPVKKINPGFAILDYQDQRLFTSHLSDDTDFSFDGPLSGECDAENGYRFTAFACNL